MSAQLTERASKRHNARQALCGIYLRFNLARSED
jgi:hypothetical protein